MAKRKKKRRIKLVRVLFLIVILLAILFGISLILDLKVSNVIVKGNTLYSDWKIIKMAGLDDYPSTFENSSRTIENRLEDDDYIKSAYVYKRWFTQVVIDVDENLPLFYYLPKEKTILADETEVSDNFPVPTVINYVPDKIYSKLLKAISKTDYAIIKRISEIRYDPNEVDTERFFLVMNDSNYVYLTLDTFDKIDSYLDIIKEFDNKKGTLYLDSGEYFEVRS